MKHRLTVMAAALLTVLLLGAGPARADPDGSPTLRPGDSGRAVVWLQRTLTGLHYDPGKVTGTYGADTVYAVWAFQKVNHIPPTSTVNAATWKALAAPETPRPLLPHGAADRIEVDLTRRLLSLYRRNTLTLISHISTGSGRRYLSQGSSHVARTPTGDFRVYRAIAGWRHSALGYLYNPLYFHGGYAVHGETSVPLYPASHGCVRIPMHTAGILPPLVPLGTAVYLRST